MADTDTSTPVFFDLPSFLSEAQATIQGVGAGTASLQKNASAAQEIYNNQADLEKIIGDNAIIVQQAKDNAALATQQAKIKGANVMGTNLKDSSERITALTQQYNDVEDQKTQQLQGIRDKQSVGLWDDPVQYILNAITLPDDIQAYNANNHLSNELSDRINTMNALTQTTNKTQAELEESITQASIEASSKNIALTAVSKANADRLNGLAANTQGVRDALNADRDIFQIQSAERAAVNQDQQMQMERERLALAQQEFDWRKIEKEKGEQSDNYMLSMVNAGRKARMGDSYVPIPALKSNYVLSLMKSNSPAGLEYQQDFTIGENTSQNPTGARVLGNTPAQASSVLFGTTPVKMPPAMDPTKQVLADASNSVNAMVKGGQIDPKQKGAVEHAFNQEAQRVLDQYASKVIPGDASNPFSISDLQSYIKASPQLQALPVVQNVLVPAAQAGVSLNDPNKVFGLVADAVQNKSITYAQALDLSDVYARASAATIASRQLDSVGLRANPSYNTSVQVDPDSAFGGKKVVDLTKADAVGRALNVYMANILRTQFLNQRATP